MIIVHYFMFVDTQYQIFYREVGNNWLEFQDEIEDMIRMIAKTSDCSIKFFRVAINDFQVKISTSKRFTCGSI